jgi:hypothetical protein
MFVILIIIIFWHIFTSGISYLPYTWRTGNLHGVNQSNQSNLFKQNNQWHTDPISVRSNVDNIDLSEVLYAIKTLQIGTGTAEKIPI